MCGRIDLSDPAAVMNWLINQRWKGRQRKLNFGLGRPNVPPSLPVPVLRVEEGEEVAELIIWQIHCNVNGTIRTIANARSDKIYRFFPYRDGVTHRRCVFLLNGFYEWTADKSDRRPRHITPAKSPIFKIAGLYQQESADGALGCCLITTDANAAIAGFHDRMPVLLEDDQVDSWLYAKDKTEIERLLVPAADDRIAITLADASLNRVPRSA